MVVLISLSRFYVVHSARFGLYVDSNRLLEKLSVKVMFNKATERTLLLLWFRRSSICEKETLLAVACEFSLEKSLSFLLTFSLGRGEYILVQLGSFTYVARNELVYTSSLVS